MTNTGCRVIGCWLLILAACGAPQTGTTDEASSSSGAESTTSGDPLTDGSGGIQTVTSATEPATTEVTTGESTTEVDVCPGLIADITAALTAGARCELLVTLDGAGVLTGWATACVDRPGAPYADGKAAQAALPCCDGGGEVSPEGTSPFVMYLAPFPPEAPGGLGLVSNHIGAPVFDASIGIDEPGTISLPTQWSTPESLGVGADCSTGEFTFTEPATYHADVGPLSADIITTLEASLGATALPAALAAAGKLERTVIAAYESQYLSSDTTHVVLLELSAP